MRSTDIPLPDQLLVVTGLDLLDQRSGGDQPLDGTFRSRVVEELERSLVDRQRFKLYMRALDNVLGVRKPGAADLGEEAYDSVLTNGLAALSDRDLLRLGLDAAEMWALHVGL